jgi:hypothetical protein
LLLVVVVVVVGTRTCNIGVQVLFVQFSCSPSSSDHIYVFESMLHWQIYDEMFAKNDTKSRTSLDLVMIIGSACLLIL